MGCFVPDAFSGQGWASLNQDSVTPCGPPKWITGTQGLRLSSTTFQIQQLEAELKLGQPDIRMNRHSYGHWHPQMVA